MKIEIYTDGAATIQHPEQPGGWAWAYQYFGNIYTNSGGRLYTTNNQMEMWAVVEALRAVTNEHSHVIVYSDSQYVVKGWNEWLPGWKAKGWRTSSGEKVKNKEIWYELIDTHTKLVSQGITVDLKWVKGHADSVMNNLVDKLAVQAKEAQ